MGRIIRVGSGPPIPPGNTNMGFKMTKLVKPGERPVDCPECPEVGTEHIIPVNSDDGYMWAASLISWADCRGKASGQWMSSALDFVQTYAAFIIGAESYFACARSFFSFNLEAIPDGVIRYASLVVTCKGSLVSNVGAAIVEGTQHSPLQLSDYSAFGTDLFATNVRRNGGSYDYHFDAPGIAYLQSKIGSLAKLCSREYFHDYHGTAPLSDQAYLFDEMWWSSRAVDESVRSYLVIGF